jgi:host factor-I protein
MEKPSQQNTIQDSFLNSARKERSNVTIYLMSGVKLTGRIKSFDKYSVILEAGSQEQLIFKHAISTVSLPRGGGRDFHHAGRDMRDTRPDRPVGGPPERPIDREHHTERDHPSEANTTGTAAGQDRS